MKYKIVSQKEFDDMEDALCDAIDDKGSGKPLPKGLVYSHDDIIGASPILLSHYGNDEWVVMDSEGFVEAFKSKQDAVEYIKTGDDTKHIDF